MAGALDTGSHSVLTTTLEVSVSILLMTRLGFKENVFMIKASMWGLLDLS